MIFIISLEMFLISSRFEIFSKYISIILSSISDVKFVLIKDGEIILEIIPNFLFSEFQIFDNCSITDFTVEYKPDPMGGFDIDSLEIEIIRPFFFFLNVFNKT